jgi:type IV secretory pathway VirB10-like protein
MSEYRETRRVVEDPPIRRARPVVETQYDSVIHERRGLSGGAVVALVLAGIAAAVLITLMIVNSQQQQNEDQLALERERMEEAQQPSQPQPSQPQQPVIVLPPSQPPAQVPVPVPAPSPGASNTAPSSTEVELDITTRLLDDPDLRSQAIDVKFSDGTAVLSGRVSTDELKTRADRIVRAIKGVRTVINNISVESR